MPVRLPLSALIFCAIAHVLPAHAQGDRAQDQLWGVGTTAWLCYQPPCGWRGIFPVDGEGTRGRPLSIHDQPLPPQMRGDPAELARIRRAYADHGCLLVEGRMQDDILLVRRVVDEC